MSRELRKQFNYFFLYNFIADLDYLCLSPHKHLGGSEATGLLIGKKSSYKLLSPSFPGGGTVLVQFLIKYINQRLLRVLIFPKFSMTRILFMQKCQGNIIQQFNSIF